MHSARLIEFYVVKWLSEHEMGQSVAKLFPFDEAVDHVFELLNAGFLKISIDRPDPDSHFFTIELCVPPQPPIRKIPRIKETRQ